MKKKGVLLSLVLLASIAICSGCSTLHINKPSLPLEGKVTAELRADIKIGDKISGTASETKILKFITLGSPDKFMDGVYSSSGGSLPLGNLPFMGADGDLISAAAYNAVTGSGADVIIAPQYIKENYSFLGLYETKKVTVTGYKGTIKTLFGQ